MTSAGFLVVNPRAGNRRPSAEELVTEARLLGVDAHVLSEQEDAGEVARTADAVALGAAGGDGSLRAVAAAALERNLPFVCIPFGTRNHFARDVGLDPNDPIGALRAFAGTERRIDVGRAGPTLFLNNVSLGLYARLVRERERHRPRRQLTASLRAVWLAARTRHRVRIVVDGRPTSARVVLVANNAYRLDLFSLGARDTLEDGALHLYQADGVLPTRWRERSGEQFRLDADTPSVRAAVDGDPVELRLPLDVRIERRALRVLLPPDR